MDAAAALAAERARVAQLRAAMAAEFAVFDDALRDLIAVQSGLAEAIVEVTKSGQRLRAEATAFLLGAEILDAQAEGRKL
jgi:hypothetical protein